MQLQNHHSGLIYAMVLAAAADGKVRESELLTIDETMMVLPIFSDFQRANFGAIAAACVSLLSEDDGIDVAIGLIHESLPPRLYPTAYALACDVVAVDGVATQEELRLLEMMRHQLNIDRLTAAAIERGAAARFARLPDID
jgi:tellurite resistance protein